eukprot:1144536-Pelagomonas_calceolata.AAC.1
MMVAGLQLVGEVVIVNVHYDPVNSVDELLHSASLSFITCAAEIKTPETLVRHKVTFYALCHNNHPVLIACFVLTSNGPNVATFTTLYLSGSENTSTSIKKGDTFQKGSKRCEYPITDLDLHGGDLQPDCSADRPVTGGNQKHPGH